MAVSFDSDGCLSAVWGSAVSDVLLRGCVNGFNVEDGRPTELPGEEGIWAGPNAGEEDSEPALKGWKDTDGRR